MATEDQKLAFRWIVEMQTFMKEREKAGGYSSDDVAKLIKLFTRVGTYASHTNTGKKYIGVAKARLCHDYTPNPDADTRPLHDPNWPDEDPKASKELANRLSDLANCILVRDDVTGLFNQAESAMCRLIFTYEVKLASDKDGTKAFKKKLTHLRHSSTMD